MRIEIHPERGLFLVNAAELEQLHKVALGYEAYRRLLLAVREAAGLKPGDGVPLIDHVRAMRGELESLRGPREIGAPEWKTEQPLLPWPYLTWARCPECLTIFWNAKGERVICSRCSRPDVERSGPLQYNYIKLPFGWATTVEAMQQMATERIRAGETPPQDFCSVFLRPA